jgi:hypothetical protein
MIRAQCSVPFIGHGDMLLLMQDEYERYWNSRIQKIMQRIQAMPARNSAVSHGSGEGMQPGKTQPHAHMQQPAPTYSHMSPGLQHITMSPYQHQYDAAGHGGTAGTHAGSYPQQQQNVGRYSSMGTHGHQMHGHIDHSSAYYASMMYPSTNQSSSMCARLRKLNCFVSQCTRDPEC